MTVNKECSYPQKCGYWDCWQSSMHVHDTCTCLWIVAIRYSHEIGNCVYMYMNCSNHFGCFSPYTIRSHRSSWSLICSMSTIWLEMTKLNIQRRPEKLSISDIPSVNTQGTKWDSKQLFGWYPLKSHNINIHQEITGFYHYRSSGGHVQLLMFRLHNDEENTSSVSHMWVI